MSTNWDEIILSVTYHFDIGAYVLCCSPANQSINPNINQSGYSSQTERFRLIDTHRIAQNCNHWFQHSIAPINPIRAVMQQPAKSPQR
ncbi:uncharacterized protein Dsimw501_GD28264 [Drosophila simulans]|nr:uncharacterized protein Dsimw501_GD28264 [Drosophila simulans]